MSASDLIPLMRRTASWTLALTAIWALITGLVWGGAMALGVILGAVLGLVNFWLLGRTVSGLVGAAQAGESSHRRSWVPPIALLLKWPLLLAMVGFVLWFTPARGEGLALGALITLASITIAAMTKRPAPPVVDGDEGTTPSSDA